MGNGATLASESDKQGSDNQPSDDQPSDDQPSDDQPNSDDHGPPDRRALRDLAREFPGALRELDLLGLPELSRRVAQLERLERHSSGGDTVEHQADERWMDWILAYHELMRTALLIKRSSITAQDISQGVLTPAPIAARTILDPPLDDSFVAAVMRPPGGRLTIVVLATLASRFETPVAEVSRTLFPSRRPSPHS
jgi:hypothetical protein